MIDETISYISYYHAGVTKIGVLSTTGTYNSKVYYDRLCKNGFEAIVPPYQMQEHLIHPAIYDPVFGIKTISNPINQQAIDNLLQGVRFLKNEGAELIILGCTEIPLAFPGNQIERILTIDPTNILARALIKKIAPKKLKEI